MKDKELLQEWINCCPQNGFSYSKASLMSICIRSRWKLSVITAQQSIEKAAKRSFNF